jgi:hypothetical protein
VHIIKIIDFISLYYLIFKKRIGWEEVLFFGRLARAVSGFSNTLWLVCLRYSNMSLIDERQQRRKTRWGKRTEAEGI